MKAEAYEDILGHYRKDLTYTIEKMMQVHMFRVLIGNNAIDVKKARARFNGRKAFSICDSPNKFLQCFKLNTKTERFVYDNWELLERTRLRVLRTVNRAVEDMLKEAEDAFLGEQRQPEQDEMVV
jgi:hypothetical protein